MPEAGGWRTGETGTGKELIARAIHNLSGRKNKVLVTVNCAALPAGLIESEMFGHEKGAFTGATSQKAGRFELADGGTIFLDEIGNLPLELQSKLLRVLQEGEFERVGGSKTLKVDVRIVAATNQDPAKAVAEERFRSDLYDRLNIFPIRLPPLRDRNSDIPSLVRHLPMKYATKMAKRIDTIPNATVQALIAYPWQGNVRELENVIERGVILTKGEHLKLGDWAPKPSVATDGSPLVTLEESERQHIQRVLELANWQVRGARGAIAILGLKPTTLESRMKRLGIVRKQ
ncbi:MAG: sigma 54-interacting transcriptional regulator [Planctomycetes bacterium]|nr:sigma 54-interacting transcriptional regulator [Planctomycetota bacterium]